MSDGEQAKFSVFSKAAYDFYYDGIVQAQKELFAYGYRDWIIDPRLSDANSVVLTNSPKGSAVISYRGSDFTNAEDLYTDAGILIGRHRTPLPSRRFIQADEKYLKTKEALGGTSRITLTGHSLGNTQALYVGRKYGVKSVGFNAGSSVADIAAGQLCKLSGSCEDHRLHTIYTTGDVVSFSSTFGKERIKRVPVKEKRDFFNHSLALFLPERSAGKLPDYLVKRKAAEDPICNSHPELPFCKPLAKF